MWRLFCFRVGISSGATFNLFTNCLTCTWWSSFVQIAIIITGVPWDPGDLNGNGLGSSRIFRRGECHVLEMITGSKEALGWASGHGPSGIATSCAKKGAAATSRASKNHLKKSKLSASRRLLFIFSTTSPLSSPLMYPDPLPSRSL